MSQLPWRATVALCTIQDAMLKASSQPQSGSEDSLPCKCQQSHDGEGCTGVDSSRKLNLDIPSMNGDILQLAAK